MALDAILTLLTLFFVYRHGGELVPQLHGAPGRAHRTPGAHGDRPPAGLRARHRLLLAQGRIVGGLVFLGWGILVVSMADNLIKSWVLRGAARIPVLLGFFGVLGGLVAFGPLGLFVGPVAIALLLTLWRDWTAPR